jgi:hypothetical protein
MQDKISFIRRRHASLFRAIENLEHNRNAIEDREDLGGGSGVSVIASRKP